MGDDKDLGYPPGATVGGITEYNTGTEYTISIDDTAYEELSPTFSIDINTMNDFNDYGSVSIGEVFVHTMPDLNRVEAMCKEYPALAKAYEQFKLIYKMTDQDYKGKLKAGEIDDEIPF